jgi:hypothetical protein
VFELNKNASCSDLKPLEFHPDLDQRQASFLCFTRKLCQLCCSTPELCLVFEYPNKLMPLKTKRADTARYDFLLSKVSNKTATMLETYMIEHKKGMAMRVSLYVQCPARCRYPAHRAHQASKSCPQQHGIPTKLPLPFQHRAYQHGIALHQSEVINQYLRAVKTVQHSRVQSCRTLLQLFGPGSVIARMVCPRGPSQTILANTGHISHCAVPGPCANKRDLRAYINTLELATSNTKSSL